MRDTVLSRPALTVQVDVDTTRDLFAFYGITNTEQSDTDIVYRLALPRFAELFHTVGIPATFFVIGRDLNDEASRQVVRQLCAAGHEIANHTYTHPFNFAHLSVQEKRREIEQGGAAIQRATGQKPAGFRAPGYDAAPDIMEILAEREYSYDSSVLPSVLNLPFKLIQKAVRKNRDMSGYGSVTLSFAPNHPYRPNLRKVWRHTAKGSLWEIPVACVPYLRLPFYANFNLFSGNTLFSFSSALASGKDCNYVFHAVEMLDPSEIDARLHCHPNARTPLKEKTFRCRSFLERLKKGRRVLLSKDFAFELELQSRAPN